MHDMQSCLLALHTHLALAKQILGFLNALLVAHKLLR